MPVKTHVWKGQEMPVSYRKTDKERLALAEKMRETRELMGETQEQHYGRYKVSHTTYVRWEQFGPPRHAYVREFVKMIIRKNRMWVHGKKRDARVKDARAKCAADRQ